MKKINISGETAINIGSFFLRIACALMLMHGWNKLSHFSEKVDKFPDPLHVGHTLSLSLTIFAEFFCTIFVVAGLFTRMALLPLIFCLIVIIFVVSAKNSLEDREGALMYLLVYLATFYIGPGKYSLDHLLRGK
jgi:putative oxidoreductase